MGKSFLILLLLPVTLRADVTKANYFQLGLARLEKAVQQKKVSNRLLDLNLARWRSAARFTDSTFILVDTTRFEVSFYFQNRLLFHSRALVGQKKSPTPVFETTIEAVTFNPWWQIPESIAIEEMLPLIKENPSALEDAGIMAFRKRDQKRVALSETLSPLTSHFEYVLKEAPHPQNPLGNVKFNSKNPLSILIHGTHEPELFESNNRAVSHGCVRVENARDLANRLLEIYGVRRFNGSGEETEIRLPRKIPVFFRYWTAWADPNLQIHFEKDVYGWDS